MKLLLVTLMLCFTVFNLHAQNTLIKTYQGGNIPTSVATFDDGCNGQSAALSLTLPPGDNYTVTNVDVTYNMTAFSPGQKSDQRSLILFQNNNVEESSEAIGVGNVDGTQSYARSISIANGSYPGGTELVFEMKAKRLIANVPDGCNSLVNRVDDITWTVTVYYSDVVQNPKVGVNTSTPTQALDVAGKLRLGDDTTAPQTGTIRWNDATGDFEGYNGTCWVSFTKNEGGGWGSNVVTENGSGTRAANTNGIRIASTVSMSGDYAIVGGLNRGYALLYERNNAIWEYEKTVTSSDGSSGDSFGNSVYISGDYAIISASGRNVGGNVKQGKAYIFKRDSRDGWVEQAAIVASDGLAEDYFGSSVSISGDYAIVGATGKSVGGKVKQGKVYIFKRSGTTWVEIAGIVASDGLAYDVFGHSVTISNNYAIVGAVQDLNVVNGSGARQGKAYIFKNTGASWVEYDAIVASDGYIGDNFGFSVSISGDYAIIGANGRDIEGLNIAQGQGKVYIFKRESYNGSWKQQAALAASDGYARDNFGFSVSISGDYAIVGASSSVATLYPKGKAYIFKTSGTTWEEQAGFIASDGSSGDSFGASVSISGSNVIIGSPGKDNSTYDDAGKFYFFSRE